MEHAAMQLNWSTFVLEIINFLVLVWILKRFLYKPVLEVIARRRAGIEKTLNEAKDKEEAAQVLKTQYEGRLAQWDKERAQAREALAQELQQERSRRLAALKTDVEQQREKARVGAEQRQADAQRKLEEAALVQATAFASRLLGQAAGAEVESRLIDLVVKEIGALPAERIAALRNNWTTATEAVVVTTAFPITDQKQHEVEQAIAGLTERDVPVRFERDESLLAGVVITVGAWILGFSLRDELRGFADLAHAS
jgi:F-type H+-transporting ATPase subunit b